MWMNEQIAHNPSHWVLICKCVGKCNNCPNAFKHIAATKRRVNKIAYLKTNIIKSFFRRCFYAKAKATSTSWIQINGNANMATLTTTRPTKLNWLIMAAISSLQSAVIVPRQCCLHYFYKHARAYLQIKRFSVEKLPVYCCGFVWRMIDRFT